MTPDSKKKISFIIGSLLIAAGVFINQWSVGYLRPIPRPVVEMKNLIIIWAFELTSAILGACIGIPNAIIAARSNRLLGAFFREQAWSPGNLGAHQTRRGLLFADEVATAFV